MDVIGPLTQDLIEENATKMNYELPDSYRDTFARVLEDVRRYDVPVPYEHPSGAVIWVLLR